MKTLGRISEMVVGLSQLATTVEKLEKDLQPYVQVLSPIARVWVFAAAGEGLPQEIEVGNCSVLIVPLPEEVAIHWDKLRWIQDYFAVGRGGTLLLQLEAKEHEVELVKILAQVLGRRWEKVPFQFDGGNIRLVGDTLLVGKNCLVRNGIVEPNGKVNHTFWAEIKQGFHRGWGVERLLWLGQNKKAVARPEFWQEGDWTFQPFYHLDLYLMPLGSQRIAVGYLDSRFLKGNRKSVYHELDEIERQLDFLVQELVEANYMVVRLPMFMALGDHGIRLYSHLNGLIEEDALGGVRCLLPSYFDGPSSFQNSIQKLESTVRKKLSTLSIQVEFIKGGFGKTAERMGALHCTTNIISRSHG